MGFASVSSRGSSAAVRTPARKLAESEHSISVSFGRAAFHELWLSEILGDALRINKEPHTPGGTRESGKKTGAHFSGGSGAREGVGLTCTAQQASGPQAHTPPGKPSSASSQDPVSFPLPQEAPQRKQSSSSVQQRFSPTPPPPH